MNANITVDGKMIKGGWVSPPNASYGGVNYVSDRSFRTLAESGINLAYCIFDPWKYREDFDEFCRLAEKYGVYVMASCTELAESDFDTDGFRVKIEYLKSKSSVFGINIFDEPGRNKFGVISENVGKIKGMLGDLKLYLNHMPMYATASQLEGGWWTPDLKEADSSDYKRFLEDFYSRVPVDVVSYDFYPFRHEKGVCDPRYFDQLCICKEIADKYGLPLWNFTQLTSWNRDAVRNTGYSEIQWLNNTSIACGVTGLQYFCYWTPLDGVESFLHAMVTADGNKTRHYHFVKKINAELEAVAPYILNADFKGTIAFGDTLCGFPRDKNIWRYGKIADVASDGAMIGCFDRGGKDMYYVVNTSVFEARVVTLRLNASIDAEIVSGTSVSEFSGDELIFVINPGEAVLVAEREEK